MECITNIDGPELARKNVEISTICYLKKYFLIAVGTDLGRIFFWDLTRSIYAKNDYERFFKHKGYVSCIISTENSHGKEFMFSSSHDGLILVWEIEKIEIKESKKSNKDALPIIEVKPQIKFTYNFKYHPQIKCLINTCSLISNAENLELKSNNMSSNLINISPNDHQIYVIAYSFNTKEYIYSGGNDCKINIWNALKETYVKSLTGHKSSISSMTFDKNYLLSGSMDGEIMIWNTYDDTHLMTLGDSISMVRIVDIMMISNYGILVSITSDKKVNFWRYETKELLKSIPTKQESLCLSIVQSYGKLLCGTKEKSIFEIDLTELLGGLDVKHDYKKFHFMDDEINYAVDIRDSDIDNFKIMKSLNMELNRGLNDI